MDLYIEFRHTRPEHSNSVIGEVVNIYETSEIVEPPAGYLSWVKITGLPENQSKSKLHELLVDRVQPDEFHEWDEDEEFPRVDYDPRRNAVFDFASLPPPYAADFATDRSVDIPLDVAVSLLYNRKTDRLMVVGDFD
tara:strand:+ start:332 stop:742 length:411 start_codon:yes stop_codon:yes gene_type:complete